MKNTFGISLIPANEKERLAKLYSYQLLDDHAKTGAFKHIAAMAAHIFNTPVGLVSFVGAEKVHLPGNVGMEGTNELSRGISLCSLAILKNELTLFENTEQEACLLANPLVKGEFGLKFYAGAPLRSPEGYNIGTVCVLDKKSRKFSAAEQQLLKSLAAVVMDELEDKKHMNANKR